MKVSTTVWTHGTHSWTIYIYSIYFSPPMKVSTTVWTHGTHSWTIYMLHIFQPSNEGFYHCLDSWNTFLDYIYILHIFQPSNEGFYHCLDSWNTFLDYIYILHIFQPSNEGFLPLFGHVEHIPGLYIYSIYFSPPMKVSTTVWTRGTHSWTIYMLHIFQPSNEGFYHCLDTWNTFLDYIYTPYISALQ